MLWEDIAHRALERTTCCLLGVERLSLCIQASLNSRSSCLRLQSCWDWELWCWALRDSCFLRSPQNSVCRQHRHSGSRRSAATLPSLSLGRQVDQNVPLRSGFLACQVPSLGYLCHLADMGTNIGKSMPPSARVWITVMEKRHEGLEVSTYRQSASSRKHSGQSAAKVSNFKHAQHT